MTFRDWMRVPRGITTSRRDTDGCCKLALAFSDISCRRHIQNHLRHRTHTPHAIPPTSAADKRASLQCPFSFFFWPRALLSDVCIHAPHTRPSRRVAVAQVNYSTYRGSYHAHSSTCTPVTCRRAHMQQLRLRAAPTFRGDPWILTASTLAAYLELQLGPRDISDVHMHAHM